MDVRTPRIHCGSAERGVGCRCMAKVRLWVISKDRKGTVVMDNYCVVGRFLAEIQNNKILDMMPS